jgi:hypothetical protein
LSFGDKPAPDIASIGSCSTVQEAKQVTTGIDTILENGKFEIKAWHSNRKEIDQAQNERFTRPEMGQGT